MLHSRLSLETKIQKIKAEIMALGLELQPGLLTQQYNVCGSPGCRCKADPPQKHGPYYQLSFTRKGKSRTQFVRRHDLSLVEEQVRNYQLLINLTDRWVALGMALCACGYASSTKRAKFPSEIPRRKRRFPRKSAPDRRPLRPDRGAELLTYQSLTSFKTETS